MIGIRDNYNDWLPVSKDDLDKRGWSEVDIIIVTGDAYVDHPSFGHAVIARILETEGYKVAILPQPNWRDDLRDFKKLGKPRLFFGVTAGSMDSMVNHYTANKRLRSDDAYTPGGVAGFRPDYASVVYTQILKRLYPDVPVVLGGIEASMRRLTHYDYWSDSVKPGILEWSGADLLVYGMGEKPVKEVAAFFRDKSSADSLASINQIAYRVPYSEERVKAFSGDAVFLPSHDDCLASKKVFAQHFRIIEEQSNRWQASVLIERHGNELTVVNSPHQPLQEGELDNSFDLPYTRMPHPRYKKRGAIPAFEMIRNSINSHRGCFGGCSFCAISAHQGKFVVSRSKNSVLKEVKAVAAQPDFKGHITDLGGPSANMYRMHGIDVERCMKCKRASCIFPSICKNLNTDHKPLTNLYREAAAIKGVKHLTIGSGIRYDMIVGRHEAEDKALGLSEYLRQVIRYHVSGRLKVAPEHNSPEVLKVMRKPHYNTFNILKQRFRELNAEAGLNQQLIPYFISSHPGCRITDMVDLALETKKQGFHLEQVQDFTPTPMTLSTAMFYTGLDPYTLKPVYVARTKTEKLEQQRFFFWYKHENAQWIATTLRKIGRADLITQFKVRR